MEMSGRLHSQLMYGWIYLADLNHPTEWAQWKRENGIIVCGLWTGRSLKEKRDVAE